MNQIIQLINSHTAKDALDALYYAARFIKQADEISKHDKDFFADDIRSTPSEEARALALQIIAAIEAAAGCEAADFDDDAVARALKELTDAERSIDAEFSDAEEIAASSAILAMTVPDIKASDVPR